MNHLPSAVHLWDDALMRKKGEQRGTVRLRGDSWHVSFRQWERDADGNVSWKRVERRVGPATGKEKLSLRSAQRVAYDEHVSKANTQSVNPGSMLTLQQFYDSRYAVDCLPLLAKNTRQAKRSIIACHILPTFGGMALKDIGVRHIQMVIAAKQEAGYSSQTITHVRNCLSAILRHARRQGYITGQLATEDVLTPEVHHREKRALTIEQLRMLSEEMPLRWRALVLMMGRHGLRVGEAAGLRWKDVNLTDQAIISDGELIRPNGILVRSNWTAAERKSPKNGKTRYVPLVAETWVALMLHLERTKWNGTEQPVFAGHTGAPMDAHNILARSLKTAAKRIGAPWVTWHVLRHTSSTLADLSGLTIAEKQKILGHSTAEMSTHYTHPEAERVRQAMEHVGRVN